MSKDRSKTLPMGYELSNKETIESLKPSFITLADVLKDASQIITNSTVLKEKLLELDPTASLRFDVRTDDPSVECGSAGAARIDILRK